MNTEDDKYILKAVKKLIEKSYIPAWDCDDAFERVEELVNRFYEGKLKMPPNFLSLSDIKLVLMDLKKKGHALKSSSPEEVEEWWLQYPDKRTKLTQILKAKYSKDIDSCLTNKTNKQLQLSIQVIENRVESVFSDGRQINFELSKLTNEAYKKLNKYAYKLFFEEIKSKKLLSELDSKKQVVNILNTWGFLNGKQIIDVAEVAGGLDLDQQRKIIDDDGKVKAMFIENLNNNYPVFNLRNILTSLSEVLDEE